MSTLIRTPDVAPRLQVADRTQTALDRAEAIEYSQCITRVETRDTLREVLLSITAVLEPSEQVIRIENLIEVKYPPLDTRNCEPPELVGDE